MQGFFNILQDDLGLMRPLQELNAFSTQFPTTPLMPMLFIGHGNPMNAIVENEFVAGFREQARHLPLPKAILCISAHWLTNGTHVTAMDKPRTIHDMYGFPPELYEVQYPAPGSPELAKKVQELLPPNMVELDTHWGLDHGAWSVLKHLYPNANIPVIEMSIDYHRPAQYHYDLAKMLQPLRKRGVLIVGSGNMVHNLQKADFTKINEVGFGYDWAHEARARMNKAILEDDLTVLLHYNKQGTDLRLAIPTPDHFFPLVYCLGLKQKTDHLTLFNDQLLAGSLSMTGVRFS